MRLPALLSSIVPGRPIFAMNQAHGTFQTAADGRARRTLADALQQASTIKLQPGFHDTGKRFNCLFFSINLRAATQ
ncbi:MAG TPA: hypothetical protein VLN42_02195 [Casimicrobiaceae bacterium]|nr:hypothetical protein [Casimicrobiaceae bacterium]